MTFQINQQSIINWQNWLNENHGPGWIPADGFFTTTGLTFKFDASPVFNPNAGYPLKLFVNTRTGEVKMFDARRFYAA
jgi:hypothetical protein